MHGCTYFLKVSPISNNSFASHPPSIVIGKINVENDEILPFRWGVGRLIMEADVKPIVVPIYHKVHIRTISIKF